MVQEIDSRISETVLITLRQMEDFPTPEGPETTNKIPLGGIERSLSLFSYVNKLVIRHFEFVLGSFPTHFLSRRREGRCPHYWLWSR